MITEELPSLQDLPNDAGNYNIDLKRRQIIRDNLALVARMPYSRIASLQISENITEAFGILSQHKFQFNRIDFPFDVDGETRLDFSVIKSDDAIPIILVYVEGPHGYAGLPIVPFLFMFDSIIEQA